jgi:uncharacterized protein
VNAGPLRTFILKVANRCNIDCDYCYVFQSTDRSARSRPARMSLAVAAAAGARIGEYVRAYELRSVHVVLHGGEPLLAGPAHLDGVLQAVRERIPVTTAVDFAVQTNATLLTPTWLDLLERWRVGVGVSLDGPPAANDRHRRSHAGRSTAVATERGINLLRSRPGLFTGILAVVDLDNDPVEVHRYLAGLEPPVIDFNLPHANHDAPPPRRDPGRPEYGEWLARVCDAWLAGRYEHSVRMLEDIVALTLGVRGSVESLGLAAPGVVVVESDGAIEGVDTLRSAEVGASALALDVFRHRLDTAAAHPTLARHNAGSDALAAVCRRCRLVDVCGGGYLPHRFGDGRGFRNPSVYCADLIHLIDHVRRRLDEAGAGYDRAPEPAPAVRSAAT